MKEITYTIHALESKSEKDLFHIVKFSHAPSSFKKIARKVYKEKFGKMI